MSARAGSVRLCRADELVEGSSRGFDPLGQGRDTVFVVRHGGLFHAYRDACPHVAGAPMAWRKDAYLNRAGSRIVCHAHGAQFLPDSGLCVQGPCLGRFLTRVPLVLDGDGEIFVSV